LTGKGICNCDCEPGTLPTHLDAADIHQRPYVGGAHHVAVHVAPDLEHLVPNVAGQAVLAEGPGGCPTFDAEVGGLRKAVA